jgi:DNA repair protein RadC
MQKLMIRSGRTYRQANRTEIAEAYGALVLAEFNKLRPTLGQPAQAVGVLRDILAGRDYEVFMVLFLDNRHRLIEASEMFRGTIDGASVHPREVVKSALLSGAAAVVLAHNHPSGVAEPSQADELITLRLKDALALIDVRVLDHIIIAGNRSVSLASRGVI